MSPIEKEIAPILTTFSVVNRPLNCKEGLRFMNSVVSGSKFGKRLAVIREKRQKLACVKRKVKNKLYFGEKYWRQFMSRNKHLITAKKGKKYSQNRKNWSTYENCEIMYDGVYNNFVASGVAYLVKGVSYTDINGKECRVSESFGKRITHRYSHPHYVLYFDETGSNLNQANDGRIGNEKLLCEPGQEPCKVTSKTDARWTTR